MGDIGSGSNSSYPTGYDTQTTKEVNAPSASKTRASAYVVNDLAAAVIAIEHELGLNPSGTHTSETVAGFLSEEHNANGTHGDITTGSITAGEITASSATIDGGSVITVLNKPNLYPTFEATLSSDQTVTSDAWTTVAFATEVCDTNSNFDITTYKFTPTVAGTYLIMLKILAKVDVAFGVSSLAHNTIAILKNATLTGSSPLSLIITDLGDTMAQGFIQKMVTVNGTTDYISAQVHIVGTDTCTICKSTQYITTAASVFTGYRVY